MAMKKLFPNGCLRMHIAKFNSKPLVIHQSLIISIVSLIAERRFSFKSDANVTEWAFAYIVILSTELQRSLVELLELEVLPGFL